MANFKICRKKIGLKFFTKYGIVGDKHWINAVLENKSGWKLFVSIRQPSLKDCYVHPKKKKRN